MRRKTRNCRNSAATCRVPERWLNRFFATKWWTPRRKDQRHEAVLQDDTGGPPHQVQFVLGWGGPDRGTVRETSREGHVVRGKGTWWGPGRRPRNVNFIAALPRLPSVCFSFSIFIWFCVFIRSFFRSCQGIESCIFHVEFNGMFLFFLYKILPCNMIMHFSWFRVSCFCPWMFRSWRWITSCICHVEFDVLIFYYCNMSLP